MKKTDTATPFVVGSTPVTINPDRQAFPNLNELASPFRRPVWIDEVRWTVNGPVVADSVIKNMGESIRCKLQLGRISISNTRDGGNFIPIWSYCTSMQDLTFAEQYSEASVTCGSFRWKLPKPLYVPRGQILSASFFRRADGFGNNARVSIAYAGRYVKPDEILPKEIAVPYVTFFEPSQAATTDISMELDLQNPFLVDLYVQRLICRVRSTAASALAEVLGSQTVKIKSSDGYEVVKEPSNIRSVFDPMRRSTTLPHKIKAKERITISVAGITSTQVPHFSLVGWRKEVFR